MALEWLIILWEAVVLHKNCDKISASSELPHPFVSETAPVLPVVCCKLNAESGLSSHADFFPLREPKG